MTKARAKQRAKAKAADKAKRRAATPEQVDQVDQVDQRIKPSKFDPGTLSMKGRGMNVNTGNFGGARRGAARSK